MASSLSVRWQAPRGDARLTAGAGCEMSNPRPAARQPTIYARLTPAYPLHCPCPCHHRVFLLPNRPADCLWGALAWATVGVSNDQQVHVQALGEWAIAPFVYFHELGHTLGLEHAGKGDNVYGECALPTLCQQCGCVAELLLLSYELPCGAFLATISQHYGSMW